MESPEGVPSLNLDGIESDRQEERESRRKRDNKNSMETQTGDGREGGSEIEDSKTSFELMDMLKEEECLSTTSSCLSSRPTQRDRRLKRHHPDRTDNFESNAFETNESSPIPGSVRSSAPEMNPTPDTRLTKSDDQAGEQKTKKKNKEAVASLDSAVRETLMAENTRLKEVLSRERRHHAKEKNRIRQVLFAIDDALSSLPTRLGKIRMQNQKNLMKMNNLPIEYLDRGDFEVIVGNCPKFLEPDTGYRELSLAKTGSVQFSEDMFSDVSNSPNTTLMKKMKSLNNLIEEIKTGQSAPIEAVLDNELCAISLLKNEIKYTKKQIEQKSKTDSETVIVANWQSSHRDVPNLGNWSSRRTIDTDDIQKLEKYIWLQKEAISVLSLEVQKTKELFLKEVKEKEQIENEKKALMSEITQLKNPGKTREESQRSKGRTCDTASVTRPFRVIKELKTELEEKEKHLSSLRSKVSRLESAAANKGVLLENEKKKVEELEAKVKIVTAENKSFSMQISSLQYINKELKDQMEVLKNQVDILIKQNSELSASNPYDLKPHFTELAEMLKKEDTRVRSVQEEADRKLTELENQHLKEINLIRTSFERSEKLNFEYMRTLKALLLCVHNHQLEKRGKTKNRNSYKRVKEILGITESELEDLFGGNFKETSEKELEELYEQCYSFVAEDEDCEFSLKLSAWLFDLIKQKMTDQNSNENAYA